VIRFYIDKTHIPLDTDEGNGWSLLGQHFWVSFGMGMY